MVLRAGHEQPRAVVVPVRQLPRIVGAAARGNPNEAWKLAHWQDYRTRLFMPSAQEQHELLLLDNSEPAERDFETLMTALGGGVV